jgi:hypothetical protein
MAAKKAIVSEEVQEPHELTSAKLLKMGIGRGLHKCLAPSRQLPPRQPGLRAQPAQGWLGLACYKAVRAKTQGSSLTYTQIGR